MPENLGTQSGGLGSDRAEEFIRRSHEELLCAQRYVEIPSNLQQRVDYGARTDGQPEYIGYAPRGLSTSQSGWLLQNFTYTDIGGTDYMTLRQIAYNSWDNRASATYA